MKYAIIPMPTRLLETYLDKYMAEPSVMNGDLYSEDFVGAWGYYDEMHSYGIKVYDGDPYVIQLWTTQEFDMGQDIDLSTDRVMHGKVISKHSVIHHVLPQYAIWEVQ